MISFSNTHQESEKFKFLLEKITKKSLKNQQTTHHHRAQINIFVCVTMRSEGEKIKIIIKIFKFWSISPLTECVEMKMKDTFALKSDLWLHFSHLTW